MEDHYGLFLGMKQGRQANRFSAGAKFWNRDFPPLTAATQNQTTSEAVKPGFQCWKLPNDLAPVPSICESYHEEPERGEKRKDALTVRDVFGRDADKWKEVPAEKIPSEITEKYGSVAVRPKTVEKKKPVLFQTKQNESVGYESSFLPEKQKTPSSLCSSEEGHRNWFGGGSTEMSGSSEEWEDVQTAIRNSLWTLDEDVQRRRVPYNEMFGDANDNIQWAHRACRPVAKAYPKRDSNEICDAYLPQGILYSHIPQLGLELKRESGRRIQWLGSGEDFEAESQVTETFQAKAFPNVMAAQCESSSRNLVTDAIWAIPKPQVAKQASSIPRPEPQFHAKFGPPGLNQAAIHQSSTLSNQAAELPNLQSRGVNFTQLRVAPRIPVWDKVVGNRSSHEVLTEKAVTGNLKPCEERDDRPDSPSDFIIPAKDLEREPKNELMDFLTCEQLAKLKRALQNFKHVDDEVVAALIRVMFPEAVQKRPAHAQPRQHTQASQAFWNCSNSPVTDTRQVYLPEYQSSVDACKSSTQMTPWAWKDSYRH